MRVRLATYATPTALARLSTALSAAAIVGALTAALAHDGTDLQAPRPQVPIEILRTKPHPFPLPPAREDREPAPRQTN
jgi:hypothetical protein